MQRSVTDMKTALVTGGTSGLGLEIVRVFLKKGYSVVATGRQTVDFPGYDGRFFLYRADFSDLKHTSETFRKICENHKI